VALVVILSFASVISVPVVTGALGLTTCTRNLALSMLMGSQLFREQPAVMMGLLAYGLLWLSTTLPASLGLRRFAT